MLLWLNKNAFVIPKSFETPANKTTRHEKSKRRRTVPAVVRRRRSERPADYRRSGRPGKNGNRQDSVTAKADVLPSFRGGPERLAEYLRVNLRYPKEEVAAGTEGRVVVRMIISKTGEVREPEIVQSLSPACDAEVIRIVRAMPRWKPGKSGGQPVNVYFTLPVTFRLPK